MRRVHSCVAVPEGYHENQVNESSVDGIIPEMRRVKTDPATSAMAEQYIHPQSCKVGVHTDLGGVPFMEDAHQTHVTSGVAVFCVYDGHGGAHAAHYCRDHLHLNVLAALERGEAPADALQTSFAATEAGLLAEQQEQAARLAAARSTSVQCADDAASSSELCGASSSDLCGATALTALLRDGSLHLAWLGDCRAVLCRGGEAVELTSDHVLSGGADSPGARERARVLGEGGSIEGGRLSGFLECSRAFGDLDRRTGRKPAGLSGAPELRCHPLQNEDEFVVLGSDGLWQLLEPQAAVRLARADLRAHDGDACARSSEAPTPIHQQTLVHPLHSRVVRLPPPPSPLAPTGAGPWRPRHSSRPRCTRAAPTTILRRSSCCCAPSLPTPLFGSGRGCR